MMFNSNKYITFNRTPYKNHTAHTCSNARVVESYDKRNVYRKCSLTHGVEFLRSKQLRFSGFYGTERGHMVV